MYMFRVLFIIFFTVSFAFIYAQDSSKSIYKKNIKDFDIEINDLINDLNKEKKEIDFLKNYLLNNESSISSLLIKLINEDDKFFNIKQAVITMNGKEIYNENNISKKEIVIFNSSYNPGEYTFNFKLLVESSGYGVFTYMKSYKFRVDKTIKVSVPEIGKSQLNFVIYHDSNSKKNSPENMLKIKIKR